MFYLLLQVSISLVVGSIDAMTIFTIVSVVLVTSPNVTSLLLIMSLIREIAVVPIIVHYNT